VREMTAEQIQIRLKINYLRQMNRCLFAKWMAKVSLLY